MDFENEFQTRAFSKCPGFCCLGNGWRNGKNGESGRSLHTDAAAVVSTLSVQYPVVDYRSIRGVGADVNLMR